MRRVTAWGVLIAKQAGLVGGGGEAGSCCKMGKSEGSGAVKCSQKNCRVRA